MTLQQAIEVRPPRATRQWFEAMRALRPGMTLSIVVAAALLVPPVVYQMHHFGFGWHDVGNYTRANYNFFEFGRFATFSDGTGDFFAEQHFEPFFFLLSLAVRPWGTAGFVGAVTAALVLSAGYIFAFAQEVTGSSRLAALCAAAYAINPYTGAIALCPHPETFGILFILAFAHHALRRQAAGTWLALLLAFTVKEEMWVYGVVAAIVIVARTGVKACAQFIAACLCYYVVAVRLIGGWLYPTANYFNSFYLANGQPQGTAQIVLDTAARWREFPGLLFTGPGAVFQASMLFLGVLAGWRYLLAAGVMLLWLSYPGGPPRTTLSFYYSYASLLASFLILPFALVALRRGVARWAHTDRAASLTAGVAMVLVILAGVVMHLPGYAPEPIRAAADYREVFRDPGYVNGPIMRFLIDRFLAGNSDSVLAQFWVFPSIPQRPVMWVTTYHAGRLLQGKIAPRYVLLDLRAQDPWTSAEDTRAMAAMLRRGDRYRPVFDSKEVLLYRRAE